LSCSCRILLLKGKNELHNRELHVSDMFSQKCSNDPIKQDNDPIKQDDDPINLPELSEREEKILELLQKDPFLIKAKMAKALGCSGATIKRTLGILI